MIIDRQIYSDLNFSSSPEEAKKRAEEHRYVDPFPSTKPALLNKTDIAKYVAKTGMIYPFDPNQLKPASYGIKLGKEILYWNEKGNKEHLQNITPQESVLIRQNSITYVGVENYFRLPFYIALRFNLRITHVHRGLLLGTGPLIDPGFTGTLMIPIHNLTTNDYIFRPGDDLIAVEFTKVSKDEYLTREDQELEKKEYDRNVKPPDLTFDDYISNAIRPLVSVQSSLEQTLGKAKKEVNEAQKYIERIRQESSRTAKIITWAGILVAATLIIASLTVFFQTKSVVSDANKYVSESTIQLRELDNTINMISKQNKSIELVKDKVDNIINANPKKWKEVNTAVESLSKKIKLLEAQLKKVKKTQAEKSEIIPENE